VRVLWCSRSLARVQVVVAAQDVIPVNNFTVLQEFNISVGDMPERPQNISDFTLRPKENTDANVTLDRAFTVFDEDNGVFFRPLFGTVMGANAADFRVARSEVQGPDPTYHSLTVVLTRPDVLNFEAVPSTYTLPLNISDSYFWFRVTATVIVVDVPEPPTINDTVLFVTENDLGSPGAVSLGFRTYPSCPVSLHLTR
jgi:hypothetical protein